MAYGGGDGATGDVCFVVQCITQSDADVVKILVAVWLISHFHKTISVYRVIRANYVAVGVRYLQHWWGNIAKCPIRYHVSDYRT